MEAISAIAPMVIKIGIDPQIFEIGGLEITWHGLFSAVGVLAGVMMAAYLGRRAGLSEDTIYNMALALVIGGIIGARALYVLENHSRFEDDFMEVFAINAGGISIYGALIGGGLGAGAYAAWRRLPRWGMMADIAAPAAILGMAVGRIGDLINGEHFAKTTDWVVGVVYTNANSPSCPRFTAAADCRTDITESLAQHPAVGYELVGDLAIFGLLLFVLPRIVKREGMVFFAWAFLYAAMRFGLSFLRDDNLVLWGLRMAQVIALAVMIAVPIAVAFVLTYARRPAGRAERRRLARAERGSAAKEGDDDE
jgi:phosphatidylglycerol:prolipoprotein diacylglycerol transferase